MQHSRHAIIFVSLIALTLSACGSDEKSSSSTAGTTAATATVPAATEAFNDADVEFAQGMIPHHEQAIEMADIALDPTIGASEPVRELATRIKGAQDPEIQLMTGWLTAWGQPVDMTTTDTSHDMSSMEGMMSAAEMDALAASSGPEFDKLWQEMMIEHHEGAIVMAETEKADGSNPQALALADRIIAAQQTEIDEMTANLGG